MYLRPLRYDKLTTTVTFLQVRFTFRMAFRRSYSGYHCDQSTINQRSLVGSVGKEWSAKCTNVANPQCLSSTNIGDTSFYCTDYSITEDWSMGENNFTYTFPSSRGMVCEVRNGL